MSPHSSRPVTSGWPGGRAPAPAPCADGGPGPAAGVTVLASACMLSALYAYAMLATMSVSGTPLWLPGQLVCGDDEGTPAGPQDDQAFVGEQGDGLADGAARDAVGLLHRGHARDGAAGLYLARQDLLAQDRGHLLV